MCGLLQCSIAVLFWDREEGTKKNLDTANSVAGIRIGHLSNGSQTCYYCANGLNFSIE